VCRVRGRSGAVRATCGGAGYAVTPDPAVSALVSRSMLVLAPFCGAHLWYLSSVLHLHALCGKRRRPNRAAFDWTQGVLSGVLRGCGRQLIGALVNFVSYYPIGLLVGVRVGARVVSSSSVRAGFARLLRGLGLVWPLDWPAGGQRLCCCFVSRGSRTH